MSGKANIHLKYFSFERVSHIVGFLPKLISLTVVTLLFAFAILSVSSFCSRPTFLSLTYAIIYFNSRDGKFNFLYIPPLDIFPYVFRYKVLLRFNIYSSTLIGTVSNLVTKSTICLFTEAMQSSGESSPLKPFERVFICISVTLPPDIELK